MDLNDGKRMFGDIKSKLGFGRKDDHEEFYDDYEEFDDGEDSRQSSLMPMESSVNAAASSEGS